MKIKKLLTMMLMMAMITSCGANTPSTNSESTSSTPNTTDSSSMTVSSNVVESNSNSSSVDVVENEVKIRSINAVVDEDNVEAKSVKKAPYTTLADESNINYIIIYKSQTDITFTITLDNPEAYAVDALRITCDDPNSQIMVDGEYKPIAQEADGTRVVNWASEDPYTKTYNIRTTSQEAINSFKVVDVRLAGHSKFQSKETNSDDLGNNELHIYKMDDDAYTLNVVEKTFEYANFKFDVKDEYADVISNIKVDGKEMPEVGYWTITESKNVNVSYDYKLILNNDNNLIVNRNANIYIEVLEFRVSIKEYIASIDSNIWPDYTPLIPYHPFFVEETGPNKTTLWLSFKLNYDFEMYYDGKLLTLVEEFEGIALDWDLYWYHIYKYEYIAEDESDKIDVTDYLDYRNSLSDNAFPDSEKDFTDKFTLKIDNVKYKLDVNKGYYFPTWTVSWRAIVGIREMEE